MDQERILKTSDQGFAAYMMLRGFYCAAAIPTTADPKSDRRDLVFIEVDDPKQLESDYFRYKKEPFSAREYFEKVRTVRHIIRNGMSPEDIAKLGAK